MQAADYVQGLKQRLPTGDAWPMSDESDGTSAWDLLLEALAQEPVRVDDDALSIIEKVIPDSAATDLDDWETLLGAPEENLTDDERLGRIQAMLRARGEVDLATLQSAIRSLARDQNVLLFNRAYPTLGAGLMSAGQGCGIQGFLWLCELRANLNPHAPDSAADTAAWAGAGTRTNNVFYSPVYGLANAPQFDFVALNPMERTIPGTANGDTIYISFWIMFDTDESCTIEVFGRDGLSAYGEVFTFSPDVWHKITVQASVGSGASTPFLSLTTTSVATASVSWFVAGVVDTALETRIRALFPLHTRGRFGVQGEYGVLLARAPQEIGI